MRRAANQSRECAEDWSFNASLAWVHRIERRPRCAGDAPRALHKAFSRCRTNVSRSAKIDRAPELHFNMRERVIVPFGQDTHCVTDGLQIGGIFCQL